MRLFSFVFYIACSIITVSAFGNKAEFQAKDFSYLEGKLEGIDSNLLRMHFTLYNGYVKASNALLREMEVMRRQGKMHEVGYGALKQRFSFEYDGMVLHELFFENLGGKTALSSKSSLYKALVKDFGSYDSWVRDFKMTGLIRGIGWVILCFNVKEKKLFHAWVTGHDIGHLSECKPLLVLDVWEHAYIIDVFLKNVDWSVCSRRFEKEL